MKERSRLSMSKAAQDVEVTPVKSVSSVRAEKDGMTFTKVTVYASANNISFRFRHDDAHEFRVAITELILDGTMPPALPAAPPPAPLAPPLERPDIVNQIRKLAELRSTTSTPHPQPGGAFSQ